MDHWQEYDSIAEWCAAKGYKGEEGEPLPQLISHKVYIEIHKDLEAFQEHIREYASNGGKVEK